MWPSTSFNVETSAGIGPPDIVFRSARNGTTLPNRCHTSNIENFCYIEARHLNDAFGVFNVPAGPFPKLLENDLLRALQACQTIEQNICTLTERHIWENR